METILLKIKTIRRLKNISQQKIADELHISQRNYSKIERGEISLSVERLMQIASILKCPFVDIISLPLENLVTTQISMQGPVKSVE
jgi:transcriptional regulator with XRE-family HTH domain